jgi:hypothetical protein
MPNAAVGSCTIPKSIKDTLEANFQFTAAFCNTTVVKNTTLFATIVMKNTDAFPNTTAVTPERIHSSTMFVKNDQHANLLGQRHLIHPNCMHCLLADKHPTDFNLNM